jgi:hypothetical protein
MLNFYLKSVKMENLLDSAYSIRMILPMMIKMENLLDSATTIRMPMMIKMKIMVMISKLVEMILTKTS